MRRPTARRGLTLVELLVTIALMLVIMSIIVALFSAATGGLTIARTDQELASTTRRLDTLIRQDLDGATARFTPPLDPNHNLGYFEYGENSLSDAQGEDTDDYLAFTAKAPPGQPFTGRIMLPRGVWPGPAGRPRFAPVTITSEYAEVIYFLRNNNLYRRVLLIVPDRAASIANSTDRIPGAAGNLIYRYSGAATSYSDGFDVNGDDVPDVSWQGANDLSVRPSEGVGVEQGPPVPNTLGDLTNRHNRAFRPRFRSDYFNNTTGAAVADGQFDDVNANGVPDFYPTLYPYIVNNGGFLNEDITYRGAGAFGTANDSYDVLPFPYLFPGAYSQPAPLANRSSIHDGPILLDDATNQAVINHAPLDLDDTLPIPSDSTTEYYTWWGFPTWAETRALAWTAANKRINVGEFNRVVGVQPFGLSWQTATVGLLPVQPQLWYSDGAGYGNPFLAGGDTNQVARPHLVPEETNLLQDDLVATNVRSFDVKALESNGSVYGAVAGSVYSKVRYQDLGYAGLIAGNPPAAMPALLSSFGHEGRIPPLPTDYRVDYQMQKLFPALSYGELFSYYPVGNPAAATGDTTIRMRRVWDSWSTDYAFAPRRGVVPTDPTASPLYPSFPPPYPAPLFGIQIQIRLAAPDGSRAKVLTIRQDFTDKL